MLHTLENANARLTFDSDAGALVSLVNKVTGDEYVKIKERAPVCRLICLEQGQSEKMNYTPSGVAQVSSSDSGLSVRYPGVTDSTRVVPIGVTICIRLEPENGECVWTLRVENSTLDISVVETLFPYINGIYLGDDWQDDELIYPHHAGEKIIAPARTLASDRYLNFGRAQTHAENGMWWREINYCGLASMMWMEYYDTANGLYIASHDDDFLVTGIRVETGGPANPWMGFCFRKYHRILPGTTWEPKPYVIAAHTSDWHWGATRYRQWIRQYIQPLPNPEFLKSEASLTKVYNLKRVGKVENRYDQLPAIFENGRQAFQSRHLFVASWNRGGFDWNYPEYQPDMELGSPWELFEACQSVNRQGGFITFYINTRIFDVDCDFYGSLGKPWAVKNERGEPKRETYGGPRTFTVTCPAHRDWQKHLSDTAAWMVRAYGAKGIYLDQLGSAEPIPCYDEFHTHDDIGDFNHGYVALVQQVRARLKELDPESYLMIENCGDIYSPYIWGNLVWNGDALDEFFNVYKYTFPEYVQVHMVNPLTKLQGEARRGRFYRDMERAMLLGAIFWLGLDKFQEGDEELWAYTGRAVNLRTQLTPLIANATFLDTQGIAFSSPGIRVSRWQLPQGRYLYVFGNLDLKTDAFIEVPVPPWVNLDVTSSNVDGVTEPVQAVLSGDCIRLTVAPHTLSWITADF